MINKKIKVLSLFMIMLAAAQTVSAQDSFFKFQVKSGHITYSTTGSSTGTKEIWWDDYGMTRYEETVSETTVSMFGISETTKEHKITIYSDGKLYIIDKIKNKGTVMTLPNYEELKQQATQTFSNEEYMKYLKQLFSGEKVGTEKIKGYKCDIYKVIGGKTWLHKGIALKSIVNVMGMEIKETAETVKLNIKVSKNQFKVPEMNYTNIDNLQNMFGSDDDSDDSSDDEDMSMEDAMEMMNQLQQMMGE